jgi:hypothetical protein
MAEDHNARYRPSDPLARGSAPSGQANDPLAELARLIGRSDPFSDLDRGSRSMPQHDSAARDSASPAHAEFPEQPSESWPHDTGGSAPRYASDPLPRYASDPAPQYDTDPAPRLGGEPVPQYDDQSRLDWRASSDSDQSYAAADPLALAAAQARMPTAPAYDTQAYADPHGQSAIDDYRSDRLASDIPAYQAASDRAAFPQPLDPHDPEAGVMPPHDEFYDDAPHAGRRKGMLTVAAVLALAVVGTAGAFGYRAMFGGTSSSSPPPVIRASGEPSKVAPLTQPVDQNASKFSYDRFGDRGQNEQVVMREEKPVDPREIGRSSVARTGGPTAPSAPAAQNAPAAQSAPAAQGAPSALGEPRRVRTVPIRPDQPDSAAVPQSSARQSGAPLQIAPATPPPPATSAQPSRQQSAAGDVVVGSAPDANPPVNARPAAPRSNPRVAARSAPPAGDNAPLSLSPDSSNALPPAPQREIPPPRAAAAPPPARVATAPAGNGGGYLVQVASQKSEADAQSSYRNIQSRYSNVLSGQRHTIRRADLGSRGIYYRAMVGPFGSRDEATQLCSSLKAAGGDCVVQAN